jgi:hypothetical protein
MKLPHALQYIINAYNVYIATMQAPYGVGYSSADQKYLEDEQREAAEDNAWEELTKISFDDMCEVNDFVNNYSFPIGGNMTKTVYSVYCFGIRYATFTNRHAADLYAFIQDQYDHDSLDYAGAAVIPETAVYINGILIGMLETINRINVYHV